jgi:hypothetical protein
LYNAESYIEAAQAAQHSMFKDAMTAAEGVLWSTNKAWMNFTTVANQVGFYSHENALESLREKKVRSALLRCLVGNPFRPVTIDPSWLTPTVKALAQSIYDARAFDQMPSLADELEKAGCANEDILDHCRGSGPHVPGCWVLDPLLGKE